MPAPPLVEPDAPMRVLTEAEEADFREFQRTKREAEIALTLRRLAVDLTRETQRAGLKAGLANARQLQAAEALITPVQLPLAKKLRKGRGALAAGPRLLVLIGGTGEMLPAVKRVEMRRAKRQGAEGFVLLFSLFSLRGGGVQAFGRELRCLRRAAKKVPLTLSLSDRRLTREEVMSVAGAAAAAGIGSVLVRGEAELMEALSEKFPALTVGAMGAENAEQLKLLLKAGAARAVTACPGRIAEELRLAADRAAAQTAERASDQTAQRATERTEEE